MANVQLIDKFSDRQADIKTGNSIQYALILQRHKKGFFFLKYRRTLKEKEQLDVTSLLPHFSLCIQVLSTYSV